MSGIAHDDPRHGKNTGYTAGCRDRCCRHAHMVHMKRYRLYGSVGHVSATGTHRRIQALAAIGHNMVSISRQLGWHDTRAQQLFKYDTVRVGTAQHVAELYERICMIRPEGWIADRSRRQSAEKGYAVPLAWDDIDTDPAPRGMGGRYKQPTKPCGTEAAYRRHYAHNEAACDDCRAAHNAHRNRERKVA